MEGGKEEGPVKPPASALRFREQAREAVEEDSEDATITFKGGSLEVTDEDPGGDPYNHTGSFKRSVR